MTERGDRLIAAARRAAERAEGERREAAAAGPAPRPGDLYALPATAEHDVEWLVVAAVDGRFVLLPADLAGAGGGAEVEVPADEPGGPLTVYGRFPVTAPPGLLPAALRSGRLSEGRRAEAERCWRDLAAGAEPPEREIDFDPDYRRRAAELAAARRALEAAVAAAERGDPGGGPGGGAPGPRGGPLSAPRGEPVEPRPVPIVRPAPGRLRPPPWMTALAAVLALAVVALAGWNVSLQRQVERASGASQVTTIPQVVVDDPTRGGELRLPGDERVVLSLAWREPPEAGERFRLRVLTADGEQLVPASEVVSDGSTEALVAIPRRALRPGARLLLYRLDDRGREEPEPLVDLSIRLEGD